MEIEKLHQLFLTSSGVSTDTRTLQPGMMFFALQGENFNANEFAREALRKGASYVVVDQTSPQDTTEYLHVENVLQTLQDLARFHRQYLQIPILALTGSNGKTTTKELMNAVLSQKFRTKATSGNLNNHIGVPLTLLSMDSHTEMGIVEMGANHAGEIKFLCEVALPDYGYITNFGKAHLEGFGSPEGVVRAKKELYDHLKERGKLLILNLDDPRQEEENTYPKTFSFGSGSSADLQISLSQNNGYAVIEIGDSRVGSQLIGTYNSANMAAAYSIGVFFKVPPDQIKQAIEAYRPANNRSQLVRKGEGDIFLDAYNANPTSMAAAIENFNAYAKHPRAVILGDMFELGDAAPAEHQAIVDLLGRMRIEKMMVIGKTFCGTAAPRGIEKFRDFEDFKKRVDPSFLTQYSILIKGSRGMALERVLDLI